MLHVHMLGLVSDKKRIYYCSFLVSGIGIYTYICMIVHVYAYKRSNRCSSICFIGIKCKYIYIVHVHVHVHDIVHVHVRLCMS